MKLNNQSQLSKISRGAAMVPIGGLIWLALLVNPSLGQDVAPSDEPFTFIPKSAKSVMETPLTESGLWQPPTTPVEPAPKWSPPQTPVEPEVLEPAPSVMIQASVPSTVELEAASPVMLPESSVAVPQDVLPQNVLPLDSATPQIPDTAEILNPNHTEMLDDSALMTLDSDFELQESSVELSDEFESIIDGGIIDGEFIDGEFIDGEFIDGEFIDGEFSEQALLDSSEQFESVVTEELPASGPRSPNFPFRTPVRDAFGGVGAILGGDQSVHATGQLTFLSLSRDYRGKGRLLSNGIPNLLANGPDEGDFTGVDINYGRRRSNGRGWEMRFFGFDPGSATDIAGSSPSLAWGGVAAPFPDQSITETVGLSGLGLNGISMSDVFNNAGNHRVARDSEFGSFEFNLLRASAGGHRMSCGGATVEFFAGLRGVTFNETIGFSAGATQFADLPQSASYISEVNNNLFGLQIGGRLERQQANGWGYTFGSRVGIYNNRVESNQRAEYRFADGSSAAPQILFGDDAGRSFNFDGKDNELAFLGELDFGFVYQFRPQVRARVGYRGVVITNIADAAGQFEENLFDVEQVAEPKAFGDLFVGGLYFGVDYAF